MKKLKVEKYKIKGWKKQETGLLVAENEDWVLMKFISGDYLIDGYKLYKKKFIKKRKSGAEEQKKAKVLKLKKVKADKPSKFDFRDTVGMLEWVEKKYGLFEFQEDIETEVFYGKINRLKGDKMIIDFVDGDGKIEANFAWKFPLKKIRSITFDSDYFRSVVLMMKLF